MKKAIFEITKGELRRVLLHIPVGLLTCVLGYASWWIAIVFSAGFLYYELNEDMHLTDCAFIDIKGWLWGLGIGGLIVFALKLGGIV